MREHEPLEVIRPADGVDAVVRVLYRDGGEAVKSAGSVRCREHAYFTVLRVGADQRS